MTNCDGHLERCTTCCRGDHERAEGILSWVADSQRLAVEHWRLRGLPLIDVGSVDVGALIEARKQGGEVSPQKDPTPSPAIQKLPGL
jgi:hypothetical protein